MRKYGQEGTENEITYQTGTAMMMMMNEYRVAKREGRGWHAAQRRDEGNGT